MPKDQFGLSEILGTRKISGVVIGSVSWVDADTVRVSFGECENVPALATCPVAELSSGDAVALMFAGGDTSQPLVIGRMAAPVTQAEIRPGVGKTWGSGCCSAVCAGQSSVENGGPHDGDAMGAFG